MEVSVSAGSSVVMVNGHNNMVMIEATATPTAGDLGRFVHIDRQFIK